MAALPVEVLLGVYLGLLTGIVPAFVSGFLGFVFRYLTGVTLPGFGVVVLAVGIAGVNGGLLGLLDPSVSKSPRLLVALTVVMMISLYAHSQGDKLGVALPRRFSLRSLRERTLSADVVEFVGGIGTVTVRPVGPVEDLEGYPPLPPELRATLAAERREFPADLPVSVIEERMAEGLRTDHDLTDVTVEVDDRGRARIAAAPPLGAFSRRVPEGHRAVSVGALLPTGMARGESVAVRTGDGTVEGTLVGARSGGASGSGSGPATGPGPRPGSGPGPGSGPEPGTGTGSGPGSAAGGAGPAANGPGGGDDRTAPAPHPTTTGGDGRVTVAVPRGEAERLLATERGAVVVRSRGTRREFELVGLLRRAGKRIRRLTLREGGALDGVTLGEAGVRESYGVAVVAVRRATGGADAHRQGRRRGRRGTDRDGTAGTWAFSPRGDRALSAGDELFVVGARADLERFREAVA